MAEVRVGTSGWSYPEWVGRFYPNGTSPARMLEFYGRRFTAVEAHSTYRRLPTAATLARWKNEVPPDFRFVPKVHLGISHRRDLDGVEDRVAAFVDAVAPLGERLGPLLLSLPHRQPDLDRLDRLLGALPAPPDGPPVAFDLAPAWGTSEVYDRLDAAGATAVVSDVNGTDGAVPTVGPLAYVRLRRDRYDRGELEAWADRLAKVRADGRDAYAFLKHDECGDGPRYARHLAAAVPPA
jgi:uncharacterized protein YecE (DUF72 family)